MNKTRIQIIFSFLNIFVSVKELILLIKIIFKKKVFIANSDRIGHLVLDTLALNELFNDDNIFKKVNLIIFRKKKISNPFIQKKIIEKLNNNNFLCYETNLIPFLVWLYVRKHKVKQKEISNNYQNFKIKKIYLDNLFRVTHIHKSTFEEGHIFHKKYQSNIEFSNKEKLREIQVLKKNNLNTHVNQYICLLARDNQYLLRSQTSNFSYHNFRNSNYTSLIPTINFINKKKNTIALRMGNIKEQLKENLFNKNHIDFYDTSIDGFDDITILKNCKFFICDSAGIANVAIIFDKAVLRHNWIPISNSSAYKTLLLPKIIKNKLDGKILEFKKIFTDYAKSDILLMRRANFYEENNLEIVDNDKEMILESAKEMYERVDNNNNFDLDNVTQEKFENWLKKFDIFNPGLLSRPFIEKYKDLLI